MLVFVAAPCEKMAEVINRTRKEAKAKISKVCWNCVFLILVICMMFRVCVNNKATCTCCTICRPSDIT